MNRGLAIPNATASIRGSSEFPNLFGQVDFYQKKDCVLVEANIKGLPQTDTGFFGFHIHQGDNCLGTNFSGTGSHYDPTDAPHPAHAGDLPALMLCNGGAYQAVATDRFSVADIIGRTVVIHSMPDDLTSQPAGNSGAKIACGVIKKL